jgi:hypothetical protein
MVSQPYHMESDDIHQGIRILWQYMYVHTVYKILQNMGNLEYTGGTSVIRSLKGLTERVKIAENSKHQ